MPVFKIKTHVWHEIIYVLGPVQSESATGQLERLDITYLRCEPFPPLHELLTRRFTLRITFLNMVLSHPILKLGLSCQKNLQVSLDISTYTALARFSTSGICLSNLIDPVSIRSHSAMYLS